MSFQLQQLFLLGLSLSTLFLGYKQYFQHQDPIPSLAPVLSPDAMAQLTKYSLPDLPYAYNALEPAISSQIMELHHSKHHQTYITNLNKALESLQTAVSSRDVAAQIALKPALRFNGGGHINHSLFWQNLAPANSSDAKPASAPKLEDAIRKTWGSEQAFREKLSAALLGIQGSGWGWLVKYENEGGRLSITTTKDQDPIVGAGEVPIFGVDIWEHAFYLQYLNNKAAYVANIWSVINWKVAEERYLGRQADAFKILKSVV